MTPDFILWLYVGGLECSIKLTVVSSLDHKPESIDQITLNHPVHHGQQFS